MSKLDFDFFEFLLPEVTKKIFEFGIVSQLHLSVAITKMKTARGLPKMREAAISVPSGPHVFTQGPDSSDALCVVLC